MLEERHTVPSSIFRCATTHRNVPTRLVVETPLKYDRSAAWRQPHGVSVETKEMAHVQAVGFGIGYPEPLLVSVFCPWLRASLPVRSRSRSAREERREGSYGGYPFR
jgi:hypothetical protein